MKYFIFLDGIPQNVYVCTGCIFNDITELDVNEYADKAFVGICSYRKYNAYFE